MVREEKAARIQGMLIHGVTVYKATDGSGEEIECQPPAMLSITLLASGIALVSRVGASILVGTRVYS